MSPTSSPERLVLFDLPLDPVTLDTALEQTAGAVFGVLADRSTVLREGDRVELLRPLQVDPKEARRRRALRQREG